MIGKANNVFNYCFEGNEVRALVIEGSPWFLAIDVGAALGYSKPRNAVKRHCKSKKLAPKQGGGYHVIIPEPDLYRLIFRSKLEQAERFQDWVFEEVLPALRKYGSYSLPQDHSQVRLEGKHARRIETDAISQLVEYAKSQGSKSADLYYMSITNMVYNILLGIKHKKSKAGGLRDKLNVMQLTFLSSCEYIVASAINEGVDQGIAYKEVYQHIKSRVTDYVQTIGDIPMLGFDQEAA